MIAADLLAPGYNKLIGPVAAGAPSSCQCDLDVLVAHPGRPK